MNLLEDFYEKCTSYGFVPLGKEDGVTPEAGGFTLVKEENTTLLLVQVADVGRLNHEIRQFLRAKEIERAEALNHMYSSVWLVFLTVGNDQPVIEGAEAYYGQSPYAIYWHVNPHTKEFIVSKDQPDEVMGLKEAISSCFNEPKPKPMSIENSQTPDNSATGLTVVSQRLPIFTIILAAVIVIVKVLMYAHGFANAPGLVAVQFGAIVPSLIWGAGEYYRLLTAMFVHFGWMHLFFNVAGIFIFGTRVERYFGSMAFLTIYFVSGLSASVASLLLTQGISAGASGAVYGLLGSAFAYTRYTKKPMDLINNQVVLIYIMMGLGMSFVVPGIDYFGHIGGLLSGMLIGYVILRVTDHDMRNE